MILQFLKIYIFPMLFQIQTQFNWLVIKILYQKCLQFNYLNECLLNLFIQIDRQLNQFVPQIQRAHASCQFQLHQKSVIAL